MSYPEGCIIRQIPHAHNYVVVTFFNELLEAMNNSIKTDVIAIDLKRLIKCHTEDLWKAQVLWY